MFVSLLHLTQLSHCLVPTIEHLSNSVHQLSDAGPLDTKLLLQFTKYSLEYHTLTPQRIDLLSEALVRR